MLISTEIINRILKFKDFKTDARLAEYWKVSPTTVTNWRARGSIPFKKIITFCEDEGVCLDYIFIGGSEINKKPEPVNEIQVNKETPLYNKVGILDSEPEIAGLLSMTIEILKSNTEYSASLAANVRSFHRAIKTEKRVDRMENEILKMKDNFKQADQIRSGNHKSEKGEILKKRVM